MLQKPEPPLFPNSNLQANKRTPQAFHSLHTCKTRQPELRCFNESIRSHSGCDFSFTNPRTKVRFFGLRTQLGHLVSSRRQRWGRTWRGLLRHGTGFALIALAAAVVAAETNLAPAGCEPEGAGPCTWWLRVAVATSEASSAFVAHRRIFLRSSSVRRTIKCSRSAIFSSPTVWSEAITTSALRPSHGFERVQRICCKNSSGLHELQLFANSNFKANKRTVHGTLKYRKRTLRRLVTLCTRAKRCTACIIIAPRSAGTTWSMNERPRCSPHH